MNAINTVPAASRAAWILVGGRSSRMGSDKARAESHGRALALRIADEAAAVCGSVALIGNPEKYAELGLPVVADRFPGEGPLAGIEAALNASVAEANLIVACDLPAARRALFEELFTVLFETGADCVAPQHADGKTEPLCAVWRKRCHGAILSALEAGVRRVSDVFAGDLIDNLTDNPPRVAVRYVRVTDPAAFANLNTPEDWRRYHGLS